MDLLQEPAQAAGEDFVDVGVFELATEAAEDTLGALGVRTPLLARMASSASFAWSTQKRIDRGKSR
ncbi:MAG: hypothetical protein QM754_10900 [Tepidisphaeraceae bacterium]